MSEGSDEDGISIDELFENFSKVVNDYTLPSLVEQDRLSEDEAQNIRGLLAGCRTDEDIDRVMDDVFERLEEDDDQ